MNFSFHHVLIGLALILPAADAGAKDYEVVTRSNLEFVEHDSAHLAGDLYLPKGLDKAPVVIAAHGGGWEAGNRASYKYLGPFLARKGYAVFSVDYRLAKAGTYPGSVYDLKAAIQFVRAKAVDLGLDPERIGLMGASAGAHLAALVALAPDHFTAKYPRDPHAAVSAVAIIGRIAVRAAEYPEGKLRAPRRAAPRATGRRARRPRLRLQPAPPRTRCRSSSSRSRAAIRGKKLCREARHPSLLQSIALRGRSPIGV